MRRDGLRVPTSASAWGPTRIAELELSPTLTAELAPLFAVFAPLNAQIAVVDARIVAFATEDPIATRLTTAPGVGPVTASAFVVTIDDITRCRTAHEVEACLGVIPSERSSGEKRQLGHQHERGHRADALAAGRSGVDDPALEVPRDRRLARVDRADRATARQTHCGGRARAPLGGHPLRDVAGRFVVRRAAAPPATDGGPTARGVNGGGPKRESS